MKSSSLIILLAAMAFAVGTTVEANPPNILGVFEPPSAPVHMEGPYHFRMPAELRAEYRLSQGFYAEPVQRDGKWWVAYYPWFRSPSTSRCSLWRIGHNECPAGSTTNDPSAPSAP